MAAGILRSERIVSSLESFSAISARWLGRLLRVLTYSPFDEGIAIKNVLSLSIERGSVTVVSGSRLFRKVTVREARSINYDEGRFPSPDEVANTATMVSGRFKKAEVSLIIPKSWTVLKIVDLPIAVKENLQNALYYEMDRFTPFSADDVFYDYRIIREDGNRLILLLAAARKDTVAPYIEALREKGIEVKRVTTSLSAMASLSSYSSRQRRDSRGIFIDVGERYYEAGLYEGGAIVDHISGDLEAGDEIRRVDRVIMELQPLFEKAKSSGSTPEVVVLPRSSSIKEILKTKVNYPLRILGETDLRIKLPVTRDIPYVALGGLVESLSKEGLNLLSSGRREEKKVPIFLTLILSIAILSIATVYFITPLRVEERRLHAIEREIGQKKTEIRKVESLKKEVEDLRNEIASINNFKQDRISTLAILKEMTQTLPKNAWLTRFRVTEKGVDIEGYAGSATELLPKLEASKYFRKVEFSSPTFRDARMNADRFIIRMEIETKEKPEVKVEKK